MFIPLWQESLNCDDQQLHQYQQNYLPLTSDGQQQFHQYEQNNLYTSKQ